MASKLCCIAEQRSGSSSPELPNALVSEATTATPAKRPLLPDNRKVSNETRFTSARSEDLIELRQIFKDAANESRQSSPSKSPLARLARPSIHNLHHMKSMRDFIKRRFSKDLAHARSDATLGATVRKANGNGEPDTIIKTPLSGPNAQVKITKDDIRRNLLSDRRCEQGGYDSDAEVLMDDIARKMVKKSPSKRTSIRSIDWTPSPASKPTPTSVKASAQQLYQIPYITIDSSLPGGFGPVSSSPNLRPHIRQAKTGVLRRSISADSIELHGPNTLPIPRVENVAPWSLSVVESLCLSQFPEPPSHTSSKASKSLSRAQDPVFTSSCKAPEYPTCDDSTSVQSIADLEPEAAQSQSRMRTNSEKENTGPKQEVQENDAYERPSEDNPRSSVHLYSMRISHHLRSGSLLSWEQLADSNLPLPGPPFAERTPSNNSDTCELQKQTRNRQSRQTSSSGFASSKVPSGWGKVVPCEANSDQSHGHSHQVEMLSVYSSRSQSPLDSLGGSVRHLSAPESFAGSVRHYSWGATPINSARITNVEIRQKPVRSNSYRSEDVETPKAVRRYGVLNTEASELVKAADQSLKRQTPKLARNNSVANTKKSKFREEFSPAPPRKKVTPSTSFMRLLRRRNSIRSRSEANLESSKNDGAHDVVLQAKAPEKRLSQSMMSLKAEQDAIGKNKSANPVWEKALKAYQDEKSAMLLPPNRTLPTSASLFRKKSTSMAIPTSSPAKSPHLPTPAVSPDESSGLQLPKTRRRSAVYQNDSSDDDLNPGAAELSKAFARQDDSAATVGVWGRYPSHTRGERTGSAGHLQGVQTRDFALEAAIKFAMGADIDPTTRIEAPPPPGSKKKKKRLSNARLFKSKSMTFGKTFFKSYSRIFRSQSTEFQKHGHGHRSSVTTGGMLQYPELEILPEVWRRGVVEEHHASGPNADASALTQRKEVTSDPVATHHQDKQKGRTLVALDGVAEPAAATDSARVWSVYYEDCISNFPHASLDVTRSDLRDPLELQDFGISRSIGSKRRGAGSRLAMNETSTSLPARLRQDKHIREQSRISKMSMLSGATNHSFWDVVGEDEYNPDGHSMVSVRRSTLDLMKQYKEQEDAERERVLSSMRIDSIGCAEDGTGN